MTEKIYYSCRTFKNVISPAQTVFPSFRAKKAHKNVYRKENFFLLSSFQSLNVFKCLTLFFCACFCPKRIS